MLRVVVQWVGFAQQWGPAVLLLVLLGPAPGAAQEYRIPAERLLDQTTEPYLFLGKKVERGNNHWSKYRRFLRRYPDAPSCLVEEERDSSNPDLFRLDWGALDDVRALEVCLWRIFVNFDDPQTVADYLTASGAYSIEIQQRGSMAIDLSVTSRWDPDTLMSKTNNRPDFFGWLFGIKPYVALVSAGFDADGRMSHSEVSFFVK